MRTAWDKIAGVYEWLADIVADYPKVSLGLILALAVAALV
jgi:hypothetical protein